MVRRKAVGYWDHSTPPPIIQLYIESIGRWHRRFTPVTTERLEINIVGSREPPSALPGHGVHRAVSMTAPYADDPQADARSIDPAEPCASLAAPGWMAAGCFAGVRCAL